MIGFIVISSAILAGAARDEVGDTRNGWPANYDSFTASQKMDWLWGKVLADEGEEGHWPSTWQMGRLVLSSGEDGWGGYDVRRHPGMLASDNFAGEIPEEFSVARAKLIHSVGGVAKVKFDFNEAAAIYTGGFRGANFGIARFSSATKPSKGKSTPALSIKVLRDGKPSGNFMAMWELDPMDSVNFFKYPLCNHVPGANYKSGAVQALVNKFKEADPYPSMVGLHDLAVFEENGTLVVETRAPFALYFAPNHLLTTRFKDVSLNESSWYQRGNYADYMQDIEVGTTLYNVFAVDQPNAQPILIGSLVLDSQVMKSSFADEQLLFKHVFMEDELDTTYGRGWREHLEDPVFLAEEGARKYLAMTTE